MALQERASNQRAVTDRARNVRARWLDGQHVRLPFSDEGFLARLVDKLDRQVGELSNRVERIEELLPHL